MKLAKRATKILHSKRGAALVTGLMVAGFLMVLSFCALIFQQQITVIAHVRDSSKQAFDIYTSSAGKQVMASIKNGNDYIVDINETAYKKLLKESLHLTNDEFIGYTDDVKRFTISEIKTSYILDNTLKTKLEYNLDIPFIFFGREVLTIHKEIVVEARYNLK